MVKKRADIWANVIALLVHMVLDGQAQGYISSSSSMEDHLGLPDDLVERILQLQDTFNSVDADIDVFADPTLVDGACKLLLRISTIVICQEPHKYGQTDKLCLVRMYLHLCIGKDGTLKPVSACMSIIAALEFCMRAVAYFRFLDPATGLFHKDRVEVTADKVSSIMKLYFYHNSNSASAHLQSLLSYGQVLAKDNSEGFLLLESGRVDAFVADGQILATLISRSREPAQYALLDRVQISRVSNLAPRSSLWSGSQLLCTMLNSKP